MEPLKLTAAYKDYLWGGTQLKTRFGKQTDLLPLAESWELSCHTDGLSVIAEGTHAGRTLRDYLQEYGTSYIGTRCKTDDFPLLIKFIDARERLSVQVHPDNNYALAHAMDSGKTELWYVLDCRPDSTIGYGFSRDVSKEEVERHIKHGTLHEVIQYVPVHAGDSFLIEAGTLHAIGAGILIAEVQQSSTTTYRLYDYDRTDHSGKKRPLHIAQALDVLDYRKNQTKNEQTLLASDQNAVQTHLCTCEYFRVNRITLLGALHLCVTVESFHSLVCMQGSFTLTHARGSMKVSAGESIFLPAGLGNYQMEGQANVLFTQL